MTLKELKKSLLTASYQEAVAAFTEYISLHPDDDEALTARGMRHWGAGKRSLALNDYLAALAINPNSPAQHALRAASDILDYRNKDLYNP